MKKNRFYTLLAVFIFCSTAAFAQPANDLCINATLLPLGVNTCGTIQIGTTQNANATIPAVQDCGNGNSEDVWYKFTPQTSGYLSLRITKPIPGYNLFMTVYTGTCGNLQNIYCTNELASDRQLIVQQGVEYYLKIFDVEPTQYYDFTVCGFMIRNDECANPPSIPVLTGYCATYTEGTTQNATPSNSILPLPACGAANGFNDDVWYRFTAPVAGNILVSTFANSGTSGDVSVQIYNGNCTNLQPEVCNSTINYAPNYIIVNAPVAGTEYYLRIFSSGAAAADYLNFQICIYALEAPTNDHCNMAMNMNVGENVCTDRIFFSNLGATASINAPAPTCAAAGAEDDVWMRLLAPRSGVIRVSLDLASYFSNSAGVVLEGYTGTCGNLVAIPGLCNSFTANGFLEIQATAGTTYFLRAFTPETNPVNFARFSLCAYYPAPIPTNNECAGAVPVTVSNSTSCANIVTGTSFSATPTLTGCNGTADDDVWFKFTATGNEHFFKVTPAPTTGMTNVVFEVFSSDCASLVSMHCVNRTSGTNAEDSTLIGFTIGNTYYVRVFSHSADEGDRGDFTICIAMAALPFTNLLTNNSFENPVQPIIGSNIVTSISGWTVTGPNVSYLVKVDGLTSYQYGPDLAHHGSQYLTIDVASPTNYLTQNFSLTTAASIHFGIWFAKRAAIAVNDFDGFVEILDAVTNQPVATSSAISFTPSETEELWKQSAGDFSLPAGNYIFRTRINNNMNYDDAFITINDPTVARVSIVANTSSICPNANVMFTATPVNGGISPIYQWQKNGSNVGVNAATYNDNTLVATDIITCMLTSNDPVVIVPIVTSNSISVAINSGCYCIPAFNTNNGFYNITSVTVNSVVQAPADSPNDGYGYFPDVVFSGRQSELIPFSITTPSSFTYNRIWIDYNNDLDFDDAGELVFVQNRNGLNTINGHFFIPANTILGNHRIRFRTNGNQLYTACESGYNSETEDYLIYIDQGIACSGAPPAALTIASQYVVCSGDSITLKTYANGLNISYEWQSAPAGTNNFNAVVNYGLETNIYATPAITAATDYRCKITCNTSQQFGYSPIQHITIGTQPANDLICNAIILTQGVWDTKNTTCATITDDTYADNGVCSLPNNTVWYKVTPAVTERLRLKINKVANDPYPIDAWLSIFQLSGNCQNPVMTAVSPYPFNCLRANLNNDSSLIIQAGTYLDFPPSATGILQANSTYYIRVDGYIGSFGAFSITSLTPTVNVPGSIVWLGTIDTAWEKPANWSGGVLPGPNTDVIINSNLVNYPAINSNVTIRSLRVNPGAFVRTKTGYELKLLH